MENGEDEGATVDIFLMQPEMVESASKIIADFPQLTIGFCHCMDLKPGPLLASNLDKVRRLARFKNLYAKVDFIGTGTNMPYPCSDLHDAALKVIDAYGPERCVWASVLSQRIVDTEDYLRREPSYLHRRTRLERGGKTLDSRRDSQKDLVPRT